MNITIFKMVKERPRCRLELCVLDVAKVDVCIRTAVLSAGTYKLLGDAYAVVI